jgi:mannan endo-1,4-beta-mannosidase
MHDYLVKTKKLDNLIWVWSGSREAGAWMQPLDKYYPGDAYVDVVGLDIYNDTLDEAAVSAYRTLTRHGKPFALAEYGPDNKTTTKTGTLDLTTLIAQIKTVMPNAVYFMTWSDYVGTAGNMYWSLKSNKKAAELLSDPWVANANDVPGFGRAR